MNRPTNTERLLDDLLADAASPDFSQTVLERMLQQARRRRRVRQLRQTLLTVAVLAALTFWLWPRAERPRPMQATKQSPPITPAIPAINFVQTLPLPPGMVVETHLGAITMLPVSSSIIALVETLPADELFHQLDDNQLLALVTGKPIALVRYGPHDAVLVMPEELLQQGFRVE